MMAETLLPCPFCEGPPALIVQNNDSRQGYCAPEDDYGEEGQDIRAFVFCHECGAEGPSYEENIYDRGDYALAEAEAVALWQRRDSRHRDLYDGGASEGLNLYPRPGATDVPAVLDWFLRDDDSLPPREVNTDPITPP